MLHRTLPRIAALTPLLLTLVAAHAETRYTLTDLGRDTWATRIDGAGLVCGVRKNHPAVYSGHKWHMLDGTRYFQCSSVSQSGHAVGWQWKDGPKALEWDIHTGNFKKPMRGMASSMPTVIQVDGAIIGTGIYKVGHSFPFIKSHDGTLTRLSYDPAFDFTVPVAVNRSGQMAGWANDSWNQVCSVPFPEVPEFYSNGAWTELGSLGGECGGATGLNDDGVVVGWSTISVDGPAHAFSWQDGVMTDLGTLGGSSSVALDIDAQGRIVGSANDLAFIVDGGVMTPLDSLVDGLPAGTTLQSANSINRLGQIVANGYDVLGRKHSYRLDPE